MSKSTRFVPHLLRYASFTTTISQHGSVGRSMQHAEYPMARHIRLAAGMACGHLRAPSSREPHVRRRGLLSVSASSTRYLKEGSFTQGYIKTKGPAVRYRSGAAHTTPIDMSLCSKCISGTKLALVEAIDRLSCSDHSLAGARHKGTPEGVS